MKRYGLLASLVILAVLLVTAGLTLMRPYQYKGSFIEDELPAADFNLPAGSGESLQLSSLRGKAVLLFFGYTTCPDVCPTTLIDMKQVRSLVKDKDDRLAVAFITVDPQRDTPERMKQYLAGFDETFFGLSGTEEQLEPVWAAYGVYREIQDTGSAAGYLVDHTARVYLVDPQGNLRLTYTYGTPPEDIAADLRQVLKVYSQ